MFLEKKKIKKKKEEIILFYYLGGPLSSKLMCMVSHRKRKSRKDWLRPNRDPCDIVLFITFLQVDVPFKDIHPQLYLKRIKELCLIKKKSILKKK